MSINKRNKQEHTEISLKKYTNILKTSNKKKPKLSFSFHANFPGLAYILTDTPISHHQRLVLVRFGPQGYAIQL